MEADKQEKYEPYMGWCDVDGCENEASSQGAYWHKTGYWHICYKHGGDYRAGKKQPKMKSSAIKREKSRDKITGYLPL